jgi:ADP-heptose:LPS heptosyltransferase
MNPAAPRWSNDRILVLKFGALGDFVQAFAGFQTIRAAHPDGRITLLTTPPFAELARASGLFDEVETDGRPASWREAFSMLRRLRARRYDRVYDLQTSNRSSRYFYAFLPRPPQWSGISPGCSHPQRRKDRDALHNLDRIADQLHDAGIAPSHALGNAPAPELGWAAHRSGLTIEEILPRFQLREPFALLAVGASAAKPQKVWPAERYVELARALCDAGLQVGLIGGEAERGLCASIASHVTGSRNLAGQTSLLQLAALGASAALVVGNDSGPVHLMAYAGAPGFMLMSGVTDPDHCAPRARMGWLKRDDLSMLSSREVFEACLPLISQRRPITRPEPTAFDRNPAPLA